MAVMMMVCGMFIWYNVCYLAVGKNIFNVYIVILVIIIFYFSMVWKNKLIACTHKVKNIFSG